MVLGGDFNCVFESCFFGLYYCRFLFERAQIKERRDNNRRGGDFMGCLVFLHFAAEFSVYKF